MFDSDVPNKEHLPGTAPVVSAKSRRRMGQALVEYVLIVVLVVLAVAAILTATGPAIGNVFSNVVYNLLGETSVPYATLNSSQFWNYVTAVANYKPDVSAIQTNTPVGYATNTPLPTQTGGPSPTATLTPTLTVTSTIGPSPTPVDVSYSIPFVDTADESPGSTKWHYQFTDAFAAAPWTVTFFNGATWNTNGGFGGSQVGTTHPCTTNLSSSTPCFSDVNAAWTAAPAAGVSATGGWWAQYLYTPAPFEGREYQVTFQLSPGDGIVLKTTNLSNSATTTTNLAPTTPAVGAYNQNLTPIAFQVPAGNYTVEVDYYAGAGSNHSVKMNFSTLADVGTCTWATQFPGHSPSLSWQDANGGNYTVTSNCNLRLRGSIDLSSASSGSARLTFFDKWNIAANAYAQVGVRNYNFANNNDWTWVTVHSPGSQGLNWAYQYFDLSKFGTGNVNFMTGNKKIEIAFRVQNNDASVTAPGWFVDDITVEDNTINTYNVPVSDNMDTPSTLQWTPTCNWSVTTEQNYPSGFGHSWSASPNTTYSPNSDCSLYLNGVIDLTAYGPLNPIVPQLLFENQFYLTGSTTTLSVEYASISNHSVWTALNPFGSPHPYVAQGTNTVAAWTLETFDLNQLPKDKYFFRFRFVSDSTMPTAAGWYIDNIQWRERPYQAVGIPFAEVFSNSDNWTMSANWGLSTLSGGLDGKTHQTDTYSLTDSPNNALYVIPSTGSTNTAQYTPQLIMASASPGFNPVMQFWTHWDIAATGALYLEASIDGGITFPTTLWTFTYGLNTSPFNTSIAGSSFNTNKAWTRYVVSLNKAYGGSMACGTSCANLTFRFRLTATSPAADGIYIGDLAVYDANIYNQSFTNSVACQATGICNPSPQQMASNPFSDGFESGLNNWYVGGDWTVTTSTAHGGSHSFTATPNSTYTSSANAILEIAPTLDFTGVTQPIVSFWTKYAITSPHQISVEVSTNGGTTWSSTQAVWITQPNIAQTGYASGTNLGWTRQLISLSAATSSVKQLRIRFRLNALTTDPASKGWWLDDVFIGELASLPGYNSHAMNYNETFGNLANVVAEGDWQSITDWGPYDYTFPGDNFQSMNNDYGNGQLNPLWDANYYHYYTSDPTFPTNGSGSTWPLPSSAQICGSPLYGAQISNYTVIGSATEANITDSSMPGFTYTDANTYGTNVTASNDRHGIQVSGINNGFSLSLDAGVALRTLTLYVGGAKGMTGNIKVTAQLHSGGAAIYSDSTLAGNASWTVSQKYVITYSAASDGQLLDVTITNLSATSEAVLEAASVTIGSVGTGQYLSPTSGGITVLSHTTPPTINFTTLAPNDYAHWGSDGLVEFDDKIQQFCVKSLLHQQEAVISHTWDATHIPANAKGNALWLTNAKDNEYFVASYIRKYTVSTGGTYRFWSQADDGVRFLVDNTRVPITTGASALPYPWKSGGSDDWVNQGATSYFYEVSLTAGVHTLEVDYFQGNGGASLQFQGSEQTKVLHSSAKGSNYTAKQDTGAYTSGYIAVQPSTTQTTTLSFYERYAVGSASGSSDPMYVAISTDGGFTWIKLNGYGTTTYDIVTTTGTKVPYTYNLGDSASNIEPFSTYQNWQLHSINLSNLLVNASPPYKINGATSPASGSGTPLISTTAVTNILIKFELDTRASTNQGDGWYIANMNVVQN